MTHESENHVLHSIEKTLRAIQELAESISKHYKAQEREKHQNVPVDVPPTKIILPTEIHEYYQSENRNAKGKRNREIWTFWVGTVGVLSAVGILLLTSRSLRTFNGQLYEMQRQTEISERPWLSVDVVFGEQGLIWVSGNQPALTLKLSARNVGKSIAKDFQADARIVPTNNLMMPVDQDAGNVQQAVCRDLSNRPAQVFRTDIFPDKDGKLDLSIGVKPTDVAAQAVQSATVNRNLVGMYVVGCVTYHSSFGPQIRTTRFAFRMIGPWVTAKDGKPLLLSNGMATAYGFEIGVNVPQNRLGKIPEAFAANDAN